MTILINDTGANGWCIEDRSNSRSGFLECLDTKKEAIRRARNKWAAPNQPIKVVGPNPQTVRQGDPDWDSNFGTSSGSSGDSGFSWF